MFSVHRGTWKLGQLRTLTRFYLDVIQCRTAHAEGKPRKVAEFLRQRAEELWINDASESLSAESTGSEA